MASDAYRIERIRKADEEPAMALVRGHEDKDYSLCDALSFVVMERLGIAEATGTSAPTVVSQSSKRTPDP